jgi:esterase/lipase
MTANFPEPHDVYPLELQYDVGAREMKASELSHLDGAYNHQSVLVITNYDGEASVSDLRNLADKYQKKGFNTKIDPIHGRTDKNQIFVWA